MQLLKYLNLQALEITAKFIIQLQHAIVVFDLKKQNKVMKKGKEFKLLTLFMSNVIQKY